MASDEMSLNYALNYNQDMEFSVVGACFIDPRFLDKTAGCISAEDFMNPVCAALYSAAAKARNDGDMLDPVAAQDVIRDKVPDASGFIAKCMELCPSVTSAEGHAGYIHASAKDRRLRTKIDEALSESKGDDLATQIAGICQDYISGRLGRSRTMAQTLDGALDALGAPPAGRVETGFKRTDALLKGLRGGNFVLIAARPAVGKAQPLYSKVLTPKGWATMGEIRLGDEVIGRDGQAHKVSGVFPQGLRPIYNVQFNDGTSVKCDESHLWTVSTRTDRKAGRNNLRQTLTTKEMVANVRVGADRRCNYKVDYVEPVNFSKPCVPLKIDPYVMGVLLGDGSLTHSSVEITNPDNDVIEEIKKRLPVFDRLVPMRKSIAWRIKKSKNGNGPTETLRAIREYGLDNKKSENKFIPECYLMASVEERKLLLAGLLDTDGYSVGSAPTKGNPSSYAEFSTVSAKLAEDVVELSRSLGCRVKLTEKPQPHYTKNGERVYCKKAYRVFISASFNPFMCNRKRECYAPRTRDGKYITAITPAGTTECQCIMVDSAEHLYITDGYNVTHNSVYAQNIAMNVARSGKAVLLYSLEMSNEELGERIISSASGVPLDNVTDHTLTDQSWRRISEACQSLYDLPLIINDDPGVTVSKIRAEARVTRNLGLIVIDFMTLLKSERRYDSRNLEVGALSRELKLLAMELDIPIIALSQLNRNVSETERPRLADLRDSGELEQNANKVIFLWNIDEEQSIKGLAIAKNRQGRCGAVQMRFWGDQMRFMEMRPEEEIWSKTTPPRKKRSKWDDDD